MLSSVSDSTLTFQISISTEFNDMNLCINNYDYQITFKMGSEHIENQEQIHNIIQS